MDEKTEVNRRLAEYLERLGTLQNGTLSESVLAPYGSLQKLSEITSRLYTEDENGNYPDMTANDLKELKACYAECLTDVSGALAVEPRNGAEKNAQYLLGFIDGLLKQDAVMLAALPENAAGPLPAAVSNARGRTLDLGDRDIQGLGASISMRLPVTFTDENGTKVEGFFSEYTPFLGDREKEKQAVVDRLAERYPKYADLTRKAVASNQVRLSTKPADLLAAGGVPEEERQAYLQDQSFLDYTKTVVKQITNVGTRWTAYSGAGIDVTPGTPVENRNSAMSAVAGLLGQDSLLAKSTPMTVRWKGKTVQGNFMEKALGFDRSRSVKGDPQLKWAKNAYHEDPDTGIPTVTPAMTPGALKQLADLQILDTLCGNVDRHGSNFTYLFDTTDKEHPVLTGVQGIDNDFSFGRKDLMNPDNIFHNFQNEIDEVKIISESMAQKLMMITPSQLDVALLGHRLSPEEIQAAQDRLAALKDKIHEGLVFYGGKELPFDKPEGYVSGHLRVVPDEEFERLPFSAVAPKPGTNNIFNQIQNAIGSMTTVYDAKEKQAEPDRNEAIEYAPGTLLETRPADPEAGEETSIASLADELTHIDPGWHVNRSEFRALKNELNTLNRLSKRKADDPESFRAQYKALQEKAEAYLKAKGAVPSSQLGKDRLEFARKVRDFCAERRNPNYLLDWKKKEAEGLAKQTANLKDFLGENVAQYQLQNTTARYLALKAAEADYRKTGNSKIVNARLAKGALRLSAMQMQNNPLAVRMAEEIMDAKEDGREVSLEQVYVTVQREAAAQRHAQQNAPAPRENAPEHAPREADIRIP